MLDGIERALVLADTKALAVARWSNFTPLDQAAMHGRTDTVRLLIERGADLHDRAFDEDGPTPLDCALWGLKNNRADDGDYPGTVQAMLAAGAPTRQSPPTAVTRRSTCSSPRTRPDADDLPAHGRTGMPTSVGMGTRAQHPALTSSASDRAIALTWPIAPQGGR
jgi:Ankyrin repeats (many copies)